MRLTSREFVEKLEQSGLFTAEQAETLRGNLRRDELYQDAKVLARTLVRDGKLTKFQAQAVYQGNLKGLVLGDYTVLEKIGSGGMGDVYKARHRRMKRVVAVKVLPDAATKNPDLLRRFYREVEAAAQLSHPNIVTAYDASECNGIHYLVMEFVDGQDLSAVVKQHGTVPVQQAVECILQAAKGLEYSHAQGIVHRDIKPGNLLLHSEGTVKILDMGLARVSQSVERVGIDDDTAEELTSNGQVLGTCDYMAPEQAEDSHQADPRSDIYSLGCTLYRLLTGTAPYKRNSIIKTLVAHRQSPIPSLCEEREDVPASLDAVFQKMVAKEPDDRYQSMAGVISDLEAVLHPSEDTVVQAPATAEVSAEVSSEVSSEASSDNALQSFLEHLPEEDVTLRHLAKPAGAYADKGSALNLSDTKHPSGSSITQSSSANATADRLSSSKSGSSLSAVDEQASAVSGDRAKLWLILSACVSGLMFAMGLALVVAFVMTRGNGDDNTQDTSVAAADQAADADAADVASASGDDVSSQGTQSVSSPLSDSPTGLPPTSNLILIWPDAERQGARLQVDGETIVLASIIDPADTDRLKLEVPAGAHSVWIDRRGYESFQEDVQTVGGEDLLLQPTWTEVDLVGDPIASDSPPPMPDIPEDDPDVPEPVPQEQPPIADGPVPDAPVDDTALVKYRLLDDPYTAALQPIEEQVDQWDFEGAAQAIAAVQFGQPELTQRLKVRTDQIQHMATVKQKVISWLNTNGKGLTRRELGLRGGEGSEKFDRAGEAGMTFGSPGGRQQLHPWNELEAEFTKQLLGSSIGRDDVDPLIGAGLVAFTVGDHPLTRDLFDFVVSLNGDVTAHYSSLVAICFSRVLQMMDAGQFNDAQRELDALETRYSQTDWMTANRAASDAARNVIQRELQELAAEAQFDIAVGHLQKKEHFELRDVLEELRAKNLGSRVVNDQQRSPSFADLEAAIADLGAKLTVRRDGTGGFQTIQEAIDAAAINSLIEIEDEGPYNENLLILRDKTGLTIRGAADKWPVITSNGRKSDFPVLVTVEAQKTTFQHLALVHAKPAGTPMRCLSILDGAVRLRSTIVVMALSPEAIWISGGRGRCDIEDSLIWADVMVSSAILSADNSVFGMGTIVANSGSCTLKNVTANCKVQLNNPASVLLDSILMTVEVRAGRHRIANCDIFGNPPFVGQVPPGQGVQGDTCLYVNPKFRGANPFDFQLMKNSPCCGAASDGGDMGCRPTKAMQETCEAAAKLAGSGVFQIQTARKQ